MPMVNSPMKAFATVSSAISTSRVKTGSCAMMAAPKNQNHEAPITDQNTSSRSRA